MSESESHRKLLNGLEEWTRSYFETLGDNYSIKRDHLPDNSVPKPPRINNSVPDIYAHSLVVQNLVIGEAETARGLLGKDTDDQIIDFLDYCSHLDNALFVLAVPWDMTSRAKSIVKHIKAENGFENVRTLVLEQLES